MHCTAYIVEARGNAKLAIMPRPRRGEWLRDDISSLSSQGFGLVVSLLEKDETRNLGLAEEAELVRELGMEFVTIPIPDLSTPPLDVAMKATISSLAEAWCGGTSIVIHCRMAYGRAPMIAACILVCCGQTAERAIAEVAAARGVPVPETPVQREWIFNYEKAVRPA